MTERKRIPEESVADVSNMNIYKKMMAITSELSNVKKNLTVSTGGNNSYKAVSERDVLDAVKPLEARYGIYSYPYKREIIEKDVVTSKSTYKDRTTEKNQFRLRIEVTYRFINTDNPSEVIDVTSYGDGIDSGDKATGKAMTYADKYALMKAYKISTGDDPDQEASLEYYQTSDNKQMDKNLILEPKAVSEKEFQDYVEIINMINSERRKLEKYVDIRSEKFLKFLKEKTGLETTDPANLGDSALRKLYIFLRKVREAKQEQADTTDKVMDYNTGEVIDNDDLPF